MKHGDMLRLRWLKMIAVNDLHCDEFDLIMEFTTRYQTGKTPVFSDEEVASLHKVYDRVRWC